MKSDSEALVSFWTETESDSQASVSFWTKAESDSEASVSFWTAMESDSGAVKTRRTVWTPAPRMAHDQAAMAKPGETEIRTLSEEDAAVFRDFRLRALRDDPIPFLASYEEDVVSSVQDFAARLPATD